MTFKEITSYTSFFIALVVFKWLWITDVFLFFSLYRVLCQYKAAPVADLTNTASKTVRTDHIHISKAFVYFITYEYKVVTLYY